MLNYCDNRIAYYGFKKSNIFVYPNGNEGDSKIAIEEKVAKHFKYAFNINYSHNCPVNIPLQNRMDIGRIIIPRASEITAEMKAYYKNLIDKTINENKLMIIGTHSDKSDYIYLTELLDYILNQGYSFTSPVKALSEIDEYRFQNKLIPGDNISITPDNIISASFTESDPTVPSHVKSITAKNISDWNNKSDFSGSYNDLVDTPAIPSIEGLAKTEDIPTTLPADGGNSDTVNNHTVETSVPADAVFTDTIYDDTEVKENIEELSSNLDTLEYSEIAGGKNLANINDFKLLTTNPSRYGYEWISMKGGTYTFNITNGNNILYIGYKHNGEFVNPSSVMNNSKVQTITISDGDDIVIWYENGVTENTVTKLQLEVGGVATEYEPYIPSIKMLAEEVNQQNESLGALGKRKNLLNPTLQTITINGITCTANEDGTYTLKGKSTSNSNTNFVMSFSSPFKGKCKLIGCPSGIDSIAELQCNYNEIWENKNTDHGKGSILDSANLLTAIAIVIFPNVSVNNLIFKPMITTDLSATYDDFVPYTGEGDTLTADVAKIKNDLSASNAGAHNSVYRGKYLGDALTAEQSAAIRDGSFKDIWVGDYWVINDVTWRVMDLDYWYQVGDTPCTTHHAVIVPDTPLYNAQMNTTNVTTGGYTGSAMYTSNLAQAKTMAQSAFGAGHILSHRELLTNAVSNESSSGWAWFDSTVDLMNEHMVYGSRAWGGGAHIGHDVGAEKSQLAGFRLRHDLEHSRAGWYWLRDVFSATYFCGVNSDGSASRAGASGSYGVRPAFPIY